MPSPKQPSESDKAPSPNFQSDGSQRILAADAETGEAWDLTIRPEFLPEDAEEEFDLDEG